MGQLLADGGGVAGRTSRRMRGEEPGMSVQHVRSKQVSLTCRQNKAGRAAQGRWVLTYLLADRSGMSLPALPAHNHDHLNREPTGHTLIPSCPITNPAVPSAH